MVDLSHSGSYLINVIKAGDYFAYLNIECGVFCEQQVKQHLSDICIFKEPYVHFNCGLCKMPVAESQICICCFFFSVLVYNIRPL